MDTWYDYRRVWAGHPWLMVYAIVVVLVFLLAVYGTLTRTGILALLFIPSLAGGYAHHLMAMKRLDQR